MEKKTISRKEFFSRCAVIGTVGTVGAISGSAGLLTSCAGGESETKSGYTPLNSEKSVYIPNVGDKAIEGKPIRAALIGCGNRGTGAANNFLDAGDGLSIIAMADIFEDRMSSSRKNIEKRQGKVIDDKNIFIGFDAYKKVCEIPEVDYVIIATPSLFHSLQAKYAIDKGKHVFSEKAAGIDPVTCRTMMAAIMMAQTKGLCLQTGTQRHHTRAYNESYKHVRDGYIGRIQSAVLKWNQGNMFFAKRQPEWTDMEYMYRDFFSWNWLCGDHVIDQLVHNIDVFQWFSHLKPVSVVAMGSQLQRKTGDIFDNFAMDIVYEGGVRVNAQARQINGCTNDVSETIYGTLGSWSSKDFAIRDLEGNIVWQYDNKAQKEKYKQSNPYVLEHMDVVNHIRSNKARNSEAETTVISSLTGAMARESAYTGKEYKYDEFMMSDYSLMPEKLHLGNVENFEEIYVAPKMGVPV